MTVSAPSDPSVIHDDELLARFITQSNWFRKDNTVKESAFVPYPYPELSVTQHVNITIEELWELGSEIAAKRPATLYGRADVQARNFRDRSLKLACTPPPKNHVDVTGWPPDKPGQKTIAQQLAADSKFHLAPDPDPCQMRA
jgi:hypothetical protein